LRLCQLGISSGRLSAPEPFRSAVPLAAAGIACLGIVPTLGGPESPLHWAMTAGMVGFGILLWARHRLSKRASELQPVSAAQALIAGRAVLIVTAIIAALVAVIVLAQWRHGGALGLQSLAMPAAGLIWLAALGLKSLAFARGAAGPPVTSERPSRRPSLEGVAQATQRPSRPPTDRHASA
jgi:hypothetical protein